MDGQTDFRAPCPTGHPDAWWRATLVDVPGGSWTYVAEQVPGHVVVCDRCDALLPDA